MAEEHEHEHDPKKESPKKEEYTAWERLDHMLLLQGITLLLVAVTLVMVALKG